MDYTSFAPMDDKHLGQFGENTARAMEIEGHMRGRSLWRDSMSRLAKIRQVRDRLAGSREPEGGASEWLLDNWYLAQREGRSGAEAFRRETRLRYVLDGELRSAVISELARAFIRAAGGEVGPQRLGVFLSHVQMELPLTEKELSLLVPALKCALIERLADLCHELVRPKAGSEEELSRGMEAVFTALRTLSTSDLAELLEDSSRVEELLRQDPAGVYPQMDDETRHRYRAQLCRMARKHRMGELVMAELVLEQAQKGTGQDRHVGAWLFPDETKAMALTIYIGGIALLTCFLALLAGFALQNLFVSLLLALPISDIVKNGADFLSVRLVRPRPVFRMALREGIPAQGRTLCVIASLLTNENSGRELASLLERYRLANRDAGPELRLGLLADLPDRARPAGEQEGAWVEAAKTAVEALNQKYGGGFYLFFRQPAFHAPDQRYMGWERKRGALVGLEGPYGLYEAADFTPGRVNGSRAFEPVRSYMVHHLGMSLVALDNALCDGIMQKRFMRDAAMSAYQELLREKVPVGAHIMHAPRDEVPEKPGRGQVESFQRAGEGYQLSCPECHLITGGAWRVLCTDGGAVSSRMGRTTLVRCDWNRQYQSAGVSCFLRTPDGLLPLTPAPLYREGPEYTWHFQGSGACWGVRWKGYTATVQLRVPERENGELREVAVSWNGEGEQECELICYLEPVLARLEDYQAHPAFSKLSLESQSTGDGVLFTRRSRRQTEERPALAILWDQPEVGFDTSREEALGRGGLQGLEQALQRAPKNTEGAVLDPCLLVRFPLTLRHGEPAKVRLALSASDSENQAVNGALRLLRGKKVDLQGALDRAMVQVKMTGDEALQSFELLRRLQFPAQPWVRQGSPEQRSLWPFGISGDLPIAVFEVSGEEQLKPALVLERLHQFLVRCGFSFDLVLLLEEGGDYLHPLRDALAEGLHATGWDHRLGTREGVFLLDSHGTQAVQNNALLLDYHGHPRSETSWEPDIEKGNSFTLYPGVPPFQYLEDGRFQFDAGVQLPPLGWSIPLCNPRFGWRTDETGSGHLWLYNAKENPLTEWKNDPLAVSGPERLLFSALGKETSFFAGPDGISCRVIYGFGEAIWEKDFEGRTLRCTAFVPQNQDARYLLLEFDGGAGEVVYYLNGREEGRWPVVGRLCLRTAPAADGRTPVTTPADYEQGLVELEATRTWWRGQVAPITVHTPDQDLDRYLNGWALYQVEACRLFARTSLYQNGGAYGFRDQLQDVCALALTAPELVREQLLRACAHQYREGDVMHWWHPQLPQEGEGEMEKGVRTRITDDLLWLPYVLCEYLEKTGDRSVLEEQVTFLASVPLAQEERERYEEAESTQETASVLAHALLAVERVLERGSGPHGLAKMGTGDWNDGMDLVGAGGTGESVWLTWFLVLVLERLAPLCSEETQDRYRAVAGEYAQAANAAWDGAWFLRGWYDDGHTLGSAQDEECQIDSIAQSFAALCPLGDRERAGQGVSAALERLFDREHQLIKLFAPPFDQGDRDPGYIRGYLPGVRENGGQYTHAAVWLALALFQLERPEEGWELLHAILPAAHDPAEYRTEPYVLAADVYASPQHLGRGGWSWYTGAAGWYYRTAVEELLGIRVREGLLYLKPKLPKEWKGYEAQWKMEHGELHLRIERTGVPQLLLDGIPHDGGIPLNRLEGTHKVLFSF